MAEKNEQPKEGEEEVKKELNPKQKKSAMGLYSIKEVNGGFQVNMPGLLDKNQRLIFGITKKSFETREEAEKAIEESKEDVKEQFDRASLEKTYEKCFFRIDETPEGKFRVMLPGLVDTKTGFYIGTTYKEFDSWKEAKDYFLERKKDEEKLTRKPILEIQVSENEKITFSQLDAFNPSVAPSEQPHEIPESIKTYLMGKGRLDGSDPSAGTYQETIKEKDWERKLFSFVLTYLEKDGVETLKELGVEHLDALTPKQAVDLATRIVIDLTKYKWSDIKEAKSDISLKSEKTGADKNTVQQLLQEGLNRKNDSEWEGNGVCRNFASSVKAVFESLKANQTRFSQLRDTYALYEGGMDEFAPKRQNKNVMEMDRTGHAWNTFVTVLREGTSNATIIDATWAKRNLDTKQVEGLDHTLLRMEPVVHAVGQNLSESTPNKEEQIQHLLSYYVLKIEGSNQATSEIPPADKLDEKERVYFRDVAVKFGEKYDLTSLSEDQLITLGQRFIAELKKGQKQEIERQFFTTRAVELMMRQGVPKEIPPALAKAISEEYLKIGNDADKSEIETIYKISQNNPGVDFRSILKSYLKDKPLSNYHAETLIFGNNDLQIVAFEEIKHHKDFEKLIKESPKFRARMREAMPELFLDFSPGTKVEDAIELKYLLGKSNMLRLYELDVDSKNPSEEKVRKVFEKIRQSLKDLNSQKYQESVANIDDYQLVKRYDNFYREFKK